ncbi:MAG: hypothetical protein SWK76_10920 [Actinomycetota bacterium]|nr:hypothetical protein [Actinomycetota bacterium]
MVEKKAVCSNCGLPQGIGKGNVWHSNGVITASYPPHIRGTLYDTDEQNTLFPALSERIDFDVTPLVIEGKRKDGKRYTDSLIRNLNALGKDTSPMRIYSMMTRFITYWGLGVSEIMKYREGERLTIEMSDAYSYPLCMGDWAGIFEAVERKRGEASWRDEKVHRIMDITAVEGEPAMEERIEQEVELGIPYVEEGDLHYQMCPECGVPLEISRQFKWDADMSFIEEIDSGKRFVLHNTNGIVAVLRVLSEELGEEINEIITEISRHYAHDYYSGLENATSMDAELMKFPLRSWGRLASLQHKGADCYVRMINPYCVPIMTGRLWGLLETFEGHTLSLFDVTESEGILDISLTRSD